MTRFSQTYQFTAQDHIREVERYLGQSVDVVLFNKGKIPKEILDLYQKEKGFPVEDDLSKKNHFKLIKRDFIAPQRVVKPKGDTLKRSFIRHNSKKLAEVLISLLD